MLEYFKKHRVEIGVTCCQFILGAIAKLFEVFAITLVLVVIYMAWVELPK